MFVRDSLIYAALHRLVDLEWAGQSPRGFVLTERGEYVLKLESKTYELLVEKVKRRIG